MPVMCHVARKVAVVCGVAAQFAMVLLMTALPLGMVNTYEYSFGEYARTIQMHLLCKRHP